MIRISALSALVVALIAGSAAAQDIDMSVTQQQRVDNRQQHQVARIDAGVDAGEVTRREAHRLQHQQNHVARFENRIESDGTVTRKEAFRMEKAQDRASHTIAHAAHDRQGRGGRTR